MSKTGNDRLDAAVAALDAGDLESLCHLLQEDPGLVTARASSSEPPYNGYFHAATLLHHVAANPYRAPMPDNIIDLTRALLAAGAEVDAGCGGGPTQPHTGHGTTLGLVTSSGHAEKRGLTQALMDLLIDAGADVNHANGVNLYGALYHTVENRGQRQVAEMLHARGAEVDLCFAAGLGRLDLVRGFFRQDGSLTDDARRLFRPGGPPATAPERDEILAEALIFACANGRIETAAFLLDAGADIQSTTALAGTRPTPLHAAAWAGWPEMASFLLEKGADSTVRDPLHGSTPLGWAAYCGRTATRDLLLADDARLDLMDALEFGRIQRARELLAGIDPNAGYGPGTPGVLLRATAYGGHLELVRELLARGADPKLANSEGKTALHYALEQGHDDVAALLRGHTGDNPVGS